MRTISAKLAWPHWANFFLSLRGLAQRKFNSFPCEVQVTWRSGLYLVSTTFLTFGSQVTTAGEEREEGDTQLQPRERPMSPCRCPLPRTSLGEVGKVGAAMGYLVSTRFGQEAGRDTASAGPKDAGEGDTATVLASATQREHLTLEMKKREAERKT